MKINYDNDQEAARYQGRKTGQLFVLKLAAQSAERNLWLFIEEWLDLGVLSMEHVMAEMDCSRPTVYRRLSELRADRESRAQASEQGV
jgi:DNA invertase Pin-like site-specific DNA recombinase